MRLYSLRRQATGKRPCCECGQLGRQIKERENGRVLYFCPSCHTQYQHSCDQATDIPDDYGDYLHHQNETQ